MFRAQSRRIIGLCYVGWMFDFYDLALFSFLLPSIGHEFQMSASQEAWLLGIALGSSGVGGILFGWLADRHGRKPVMTWTILLFSLGTAGCAWAPTPSWLFVLRALTGLGVGGEWAVGHALVAESVEISKRGRASAWLQSGEPVGVALAAFMGFLMTPLIGWRAVMLVSGVTALWAFVIRRYLPESSLWSRVHSEKTRAEEEEIHKARAWLASPKGISVFLRSLLLAIFKLGTYWTCYVWLPKFFVGRFHEPIGRSFLWIMTAQTGQFIGMMGFGPSADRFGRRQAFTAFSLVTAIALATLAFQWAWLLEHRMVFWLTMFVLGLGSGCTAGFGALLAELYPTAVRNSAMGASYNLARGAQLFAPTVVALAVAKWDVTGGLCVPMTLALLTASWVWTLPETRGRDLAKFSYK